MTLKYMNADEIASSMAKVLGDSDFQAIHKKASFNKKAEDEDALLKAVEDLDIDFDEEEGFEDIANEDIEIEEPMDEEEFESEIWGKEEDGEDDEELNKEIKDKQDELEYDTAMSDLYNDAHKDDFKEAVDFDLDDFATEAALKVAKSNLIKMANMFDNKGFAGIASILDQAVIKLSEKKEKCVCKCDKDKCECKPPCKCPKCEC